jgi:hypothetical protein
VKCPVREWIARGATRLQFYGDFANKSDRPDQQIKAVVAGINWRQGCSGCVRGNAPRCITLDNLWGPDPARKPAFIDSANKGEEVEPFNRSAFRDFGSDDLDAEDDPDEVDGFLEWLEKSLPFADPNVPTTG